MAGFFIAPLASIPQALFAPFFIVASQSARLEVRIIAALFVGLSSQVWFTWQRRLLPSVRIIPSLRGSIDRFQQLTCEAIRIAILSWPLFFIACLLAIFDEDDLAVGAIEDMLMIVTLSAFVTRFTSRRIRLPRRQRSSRGGVLAQRAFADVLSWALVYVAVRHLLMVVSLSSAAALAIRENDHGCVFVAVGTFAGFLPLRGIIDRARDQLAGIAPFVIASPHVLGLERWRQFWAALLFIMVSCGLGTSVPLIVAGAGPLMLMPAYACGVVVLFMSARSCSSPRVLELIIMSLPAVITLATTHA